MKKTLSFLIISILLFAFGGLCAAADEAIVGVWSLPILKGNDKGKERSHVESYAQGGAYFGKIVKLTTVPPDTVCVKCKRDKKDKPLLGMVILRDLTKEPGQYAGKILEVEEGKEYKCTIRPVSKDKLKLTACLMFICESHYWTRVE